MMIFGSKFAIRAACSVLLFAALCIHQGASSTAQTTREPGAAFILRMENGEMACREGTPAEREAMAQRETSGLREIPRPARGEAPEQTTGLKITLRSTAQLEGFPAAKAAFLRAAQSWEALIRTPITVVVDVDYGPTLFGQPFAAGAIGSTQAQLATNSQIYPAFRAALLARLSSAQETSLYNALPTTTVPTDLGATAALSGPTPLFRAAGFLNATADPAAEQAQLGAPPSLGFNSAFNFDFDPSDGIGANAIDFDSVAFHEMGHVLGFISNVGVRELLPASDVLPSVLDLFRLRPGGSLATFPTAQRILSSGGSQVFFDGGVVDIPLSTGRPDNTGGDGEQASHLQGIQAFGGYLGTMIPTISFGFRNLTTLADLRIMDAIGYSLRTASAQGAGELKLDDGTVEGGLRNDGLMIVNRLTPAAYPATLQSLRIQFRSFSGQPDPTGKPITLVYFTDPAGSGAPPATAQPTRISTTVPGISATTFFEFPIQNGPTINSGDFYVGYLSPTPNQGVGFPLDTNGTAFGRSFLSLSDGATFQAIAPPPGTTSANATIRAVVASASNAPVVDAAPASLDFGNVNAGATADRRITIRNTGNAILTINGAATDNIRFGIAALTGSFIIPPGGQEAIAIRFLPVAAGAQTATLSIPTNDPARPLINVPLSGTGVVQQNNRVLRLVAAGGAPGANVTVPVELVSQGDENGLGFSLAYDPAVLTNPQAVLGADAAGASFNVNANQAAQGRLGIGLVLPAGQKFAAGTRRIANVTFTIAAGATAASTNLTFGDQPIAREVVDVAANALSTSYSGAAVTITQGVEADVAPRSNGNGAVTVADWVQVGRFVAGLDSLAAGAEFQRADCAPRDSRGNGALTVADWVQAGRYAAGLDPLTTAGGPTGPTTTSARNADCATGFGPCAPFALNSRVLDFLAPATGVAGPLSIARGPGNTVEILLDARGEENALGFSLRFNPREMRFLSAATGPDAADAALQINAAAAARGRVGFALALPADRAFAPGARRLVAVRFLRLTRTAPALEFDDLPVRREAADRYATPLR